MWFGFLGGAAAWSVQELAGYALMAHSCDPLGTPLASPTTGPAWFATLAISVTALAVALAAYIVSRRTVARTNVDPALGWSGAAAESDRTTARRYLAFGGQLMGVVFTLLIVFNAIALLAETPCRY